MSNNNNFLLICDCGRDRTFSLCDVKLWEKWGKNPCFVGRVFPGKINYCGAMTLYIWKLKKKWKKILYFQWLGKFLLFFNFVLFVEKNCVGSKCDGTPLTQSIGCNLHIRVEFSKNLNDRRLIVGNFCIKTRTFIWIFNEIRKMG